MMRCFQQKKSKVKNMNSSVLSMIVLGGFFAACTPEPSRRSAVDSASLCSNNPDRPVYQGNCLRTKAVQQTEDTNRREPLEELPPPDARLPGAGAPGAPGAPEAASPASPASPAAPAAPPVAAPAKPDPDAQKADAIKVITDAIDKHGADAVAGIEKTLGGGGSKPSSDRPTADKIYVVTFSKDSFIGIADSSVVKNCFVGAGSVIEVKGQPQKVTEFSSMGVNQYVTGEALEVNLMGGSSESCGLKGRDFVYIGGHASVSAKP
jgi:hypothetical protein